MQKQAGEKTTLCCSALKKHCTACHIIDKEFNLVFWNDAATRLGQGRFAEKKVLGKNIFKLFPWLGYRKKAYAKALNGKASKASEGLVFGKKKFFIETSLVPLAFKDKKFVLTVLNDATAEKLGEEKLIQEKNKVEGFLNASPDPVLVIDSKGKILFANKASFDLAGFREKELIGKSIFALRKVITPKSMVDISKNFAKRMLGLKVEPYEIELLSKKKEKHFELRASVLKEQNKIIGEVVILRNLSGRKRLLEMLEKEKNRLKSYLDLAGIFFVVIGADEKVKLVNKKGCEILGHKEEEIVGSNWFDNFLPECDRTKVRAVFTKLIAEKIKPVEYYENPVLTKSGDERLIAWHNSILRDEAGKIAGTLSSGEDITEKTKAKQALKESEEKFKAFAEKGLAGVYMLQENRLVYVNEALAKIFGLSAASMLGRNPFDFVVEEDRKLVEENIRKRIEGIEKSIEYELRILDKNKKIHFLHVLGTVIDFKGKPSIIGTVLDVTEQKKATADLEKFNKFAVGRELKMIELKERIKKLEGKLLKKL